MLIDADNAQPSITEGLLAEVAKYGTAHVKRAYGDWTAPQLKGWKDQLLSQSIQPIQQFAYTRGKNATDAAMVIDAMDLLYSGRFDGFCIVSSDSDFTRLAARLRESALTVYGFGERKTPKPFVAACDKFIYIENLTFDDSDEDEDEADGASRPHGVSAKPTRRRPATAAELKNDVSLVTFLRNALEAASDDDGWAPLAGVGNIITNQRPDFDPRSYGFRKLSDLITATTLFETDRRSPGDGKQPIIYARLKRRRQPAKRINAKAVAPLKALRGRPALDRVDPLGDPGGFAVHKLRVAEGVGKQRGALVSGDDLDGEIAAVSAAHGQELPLRPVDRNPHQLGGDARAVRALVQLRAERAARAAVPRDQVALLR